MGLKRLSAGIWIGWRCCPTPSCLFAFQAWKSYLLVALMILIGFGLRHSALPKPFLAVVYLTIGAALIFAGGQYFKNRFKFD